MQDKTQITAAHQQVTAGHDQEFREELGKTCMDGGTCHHKEICTERCFRRECCQPLTQAMNAGLAMQQWRYPHANQLHELESIAQRYAHEFENAGRETYGEDAEKAARKAKTKLTAALTDFLGKIAAPQAAPAAVAVPDGFTLVPIVPTDAMMDAGSDAGDGHDWQGAEVVWSAMVTAARAAPAATPAADAPLPLLVRDIARELGITCAEACLALKPLGNFSTNTAVTAEMLAKLRECFPERVPASEVAGARERMTAGRACYFMERFLKEEKLLGPNEQAALHYVIDMLEAAAAPVVLPEPAPTPCRSMFATQREYADAMAQHRKNWAEVEAERALLATATGLPAQAAHDRHGVAPNIDKWKLVDGDMREACDGLLTYHADAYREGLADAPQAQADARDALTPAARDVLAERARQISSEGWTPERDDEYRGEELALGAAWYATPTFTRNTLDANDMSLWPVSWADSWFKPGDRRRELTKAGALVLAAIERIDRAAIAAAKGE